MAISVTLLTETGQTADQTSYAFSAATLTAGNLYYLFANGGKLDTRPTPTASSTGVTWDLITSIQWKPIGASGDCRLAAFRCIPGSTQTGTTVTVDYGATTMEGFYGFILEVTGMATGANGATATVQSVTNATDSAATSPTTNALAAFADATNNVVIACGGTSSADAISGEAGYTVLGDQTVSIANGTMHGRCEWNTGEDTTPTFTTISARQWGVIALEVAIATAGGTPIAVIDAPRRAQLMEC